MRDQQIESPVVKRVRLQTFQTQSKVWQFSQSPVALDPRSMTTYSPIVYFGTSEPVRKARAGGRNKPRKS